MEIIMENKKKTVQAQAKKAVEDVTKKAAPIAKAAEEGVTKAVKAVNENPSVKEAKKAVKDAAKEVKPVVEKAEKEVKKVTKKAATAAKKATAKKEVKASINVQFGGKSYNADELVKIAKDVWKYDLKKKVGDFKTVELYVKPEENQCYYVINGEVTGNFFI